MAIAMQKKLLLLIFLGLSALLTHADEAGAQSRQAVELHFFWSHRCPHCLQAEPFLQKLEQTYPWLQVHRYDLINNRDNVNRYISMAGALGQPANAVPGFIFCGQMLTGFDSADGIGKELESRLLSCYSSIESAQAERDTLNIPVLGKIHYRDFSLPVFTLIIAALDAFNPCAFFVLFFLLSLIVHSRSRARIALIGGTFVLFSGLMYFMFMAAWLNLFLLTGPLAFITAIAGIIAILVGAINVKDYFFFKQGISLSIPDAAQSKIFQRMRNLTQAGQWPATLAATVVLAIAANSYELLCTAGLPMVYTRVLTLNELSPLQYYLYLGLYNLIYIVPLLLIVAGFTLTLGHKKLSEQEGRLLKLLSGAMMLGFGGILLAAPDLLNNMWVSIAVVLAAIVIAVIFYGIEHFRKKPL